MDLLRKRTVVWRPLFWRPTVVIVLVVWGLVGAYDTLQGQLLPSAWQGRIPRVLDLLGLSWPWWIVVGLLALLVAILEAAYRGMSRYALLQRDSARLKHLLQYLRARRLESNDRERFLRALGSVEPKDVVVHYLATGTSLANPYAADLVDAFLTVKWKAGLRGEQEGNDRQGVFMYRDSSRIWPAQQAVLDGFKSIGVAVGTIHDGSRHVGDRIELFVGEMPPYFGNPEPAQTSEGQPQSPDSQSSDSYFIGRLDELLREAVRIQDELAKVGPQATPPIVDAVWKWSDAAANLMEPRYPGDALAIKGLPPEADKYERKLLAGYMTQAAGWLVKRREELRGSRN